MMLHTASPFAWIGGLACLTWAIYFIATYNTSLGLAAAGLLHALAILFRPDLGLAALLSAAPALWLANARHRATYLVGLACGLLPLGYMAWRAGLLNTWDNLFAYPVIFSSPGRRLPVFESPAYLVRWELLYLVSCALNLSAALIAMRRKYHRQVAVTLSAIALVSIGVGHQLFQRFDYNHIVFSVFVPFAFVPFSIAVMLSLSDKESTIASNAVAAIASVALLASLGREIIGFTRVNLVSLTVGRPAVSFEVAVNNRSYPLESPRRAQEFTLALNRLVEYSKPGERLFVGPADLRRTNYNDTFVYYLVPQLVPATYFLEMNPFSANRHRSRLPRDVSSADWLLLDHSYDDWTEPNRSMEVHDTGANEVVITDFEKLGQVGPLDLYRKRQ